MTAEVVERPFAHVTSDGQYQVGMEGYSWEDGAPTCKIAGIAYTGSNPVPATLPLSCGNVIAVGPVTPPRRAGIRSDFPPPDAAPTPTASLAAG